MSSKTEIKHHPSHENKPALVVFLLDRSGSMDVCAKETVEGFNGYITELENGDADGRMRFTLVQFDTIGIDTVCRAQPLKKVKRLTAQTYRPRGGTPLYDAMGKTMAQTLEDCGKDYKVLFVTSTDGQENASTEWNTDSIRKAIKDYEDNHGWTFAHIGMGADAWDQCQRMAAGTSSALNILRSTNSAHDVSKQYGRLAAQTMKYSHSAGGQTVSSFWKQDDDEKPDAAH